VTITCKACGQSTEVKMALGAVRYSEQIMRLHKLYSCNNTSGRRNNASAQSKDLQDGGRR
jgi:hypothetical protein